MATGIVYLDVDDEITSAAARIRQVPGRRAAVVLPYGSRVATSRINFRLLSRDALINEKQLAVVAGDSATRSLAARKCALHTRLGALVTATEQRHIMAPLGQGAGKGALFLDQLPVQPL